MKFAVEGLSVSVATEVEQFGIKTAVVAPGFFRTDLLDARNVRWPSNIIEDYAAEGDIKRRGRLIMAGSRVIQRSWARFWSKLLAWRTRRNSSSLEATPSIVVTLVFEARLQEMRAYEDLSKSTDSIF
jgi:NAD(P)-dependent dehydrogenase (short-subunit alcohol dehydrogenase family)